MPEIIRIRKKPVTLESLQWTGDNYAQLQEFTGGRHTVRGYLFLTVDAFSTGYFDAPDITAAVWDKHHSSWVGLRDGDHVVKGLSGEFWPIAAYELPRLYDILDSKEETGA